MVWSGPNTCDNSSRSQCLHIRFHFCRQRNGLWWFLASKSFVNTDKPVVWQAVAADPCIRYQIGLLTLIPKITTLIRGCFINLLYYFIFFFFITFYLSSPNVINMCVSPSWKGRWQQFSAVPTRFALRVDKGIMLTVYFKQYTPKPPPPTVMK